MTQTSHSEQFNPLAGALAYAVPGLGYFYLGQTRRAVTLLLAILGLIIAGTLIGGIDVVDRHKDMWWFLPQAGAGPVVFFIDWLHRGPLVQEVTRSVARVNEVGTLFVVMAGMVNIIAVIDCAWRTPDHRVGGGEDA